jgi:hypothetical protein
MVIGHHHLRPFGMGCGPVSLNQNPKHNPNQQANQKNQKEENSLLAAFHIRTS